MRFGAVPLGKSWLDLKDCIWAIEAAAPRLPWRTVCIEQGLAAQRLLRRGGIDAVLHYGIRNQPTAANLEAHVWVTVGGETVIGGEAVPGYAEVATFS